MTDLDQARDKIEDILNEREYQIYYEDNRNFLEKWWDSVVEWFQELIASIFNSLEPSNGLASGLVIIMVIVVIVLVVLAIYFLVRNYRRKREFQDSEPLYHNHEKDWTYREHLVEANKLEQKGSYQLAIRHMFLALLLHFHQRGFVEARIWKTNWEYYEELKKLQKERAESFYQLARSFEDVVYGEQTVGSELYVSYKTAVMRWIEEQLENDKVEG
ncbi:DUF4129 domain-containing protein [Ornithinibacillus californiensis]|uniref:DUF4129 domain-containing protein n=1 Tax=Ornithinibacillus californiensis TaxID=161536 RepID=UPI00064DB83E|nr:DUF4129 domain-containing protein [Ornithinibacillus californiensis]